MIYIVCSILRTALLEFLMAALAFDLLTEILTYLTAAVLGAVIVLYVQRVRRPSKHLAKQANKRDLKLPLLRCIRERRSIFPRNYDANKSVSRAVMERMLEAAMWAPFHGPVPPWHFVVLGRKQIIQMQRTTIAYYDAHWKEHWDTNADFLKSRTRYEKEITNRWAPVSYMIAIVVRRRAGSKLMPYWEEAAATSCAVQNMHLQASAEKDVACYWSSWHSAARDSEQMRKYLDIGVDDRCLGFFIVGMAKPGLKDKRKRRADKHLSVVWRDSGMSSDG